MADHQNRTFRLLCDFQRDMAEGLLAGTETLNTEDHEVALGGVFRDNASGIVALDDLHSRIAWGFVSGDCGKRASCPRAG